MKNIAVYRRPNYAASRRNYRRANASPFPNAARTGYYLDRLLDAALAAASTIGVVVTLLYLFVVF